MIASLALPGLVKKQLRKISKSEPQYAEEDTHSHPKSKFY